MARELVLWVSHASVSGVGARSSEPQRCSHFGIASIYFYTFRRKTTNFGVVTHNG